MTKRRANRSLLRGSGWRLMYAMALYFTVFEGALRKWVLPGYQQWLYFGSNVFAICAFVGFAAERRMRREPVVPRHPANFALVLLAVLSAGELLNPRLPALYVGLLGVMSYWIFVPLMYLTPFAFRGHELQRFWNRFMVCALLPLAVGFVQFASPADSAVNRYAWSENDAGPDVALFGAHKQARITGTFSFITGYTAYLTMIILVALCIAVGAKTRRMRAASYSLLVLAVANLLMTGSRGPFLVVAVAIPILLFANYRFGTGAKLRAVWMVGIGIPLMVGFVSFYAPRAKAAFEARATAHDDIPARIGRIVTQPIWALSVSGPWGYGIGTTHQAAAAILRSQAIVVPEADTPPPAEGEWERIILEMGPLGFMLVLGIRLTVSYRLWVTFKRLRGADAQPLVLAALIFSLSYLVQPLVFDHTASVFYWALAGFGLLPVKPRPSAGRAAPVMVRHDLVHSPAARIA